MRNNPTSKSGFFNPRIFLAVLLCSSGALLAMLSLAAVPLSRTASSARSPTPISPTHFNATSPVIVTEFSDFQCPYCKRAASMVEQVRRTYGERVKVVFKQMPLRMHQHAFKAAQAAVCAGEQGKFWEYHDRLFASADLSIDALQRIAAEVGLKQNEFNQCLSSEASRAAVEKDVTEANRLGVRGTPTFFVNGTALRGATSFAALKQQIDGAMSGLHPTVATTSSPLGSVWQFLPKDGVDNTLALVQKAALTRAAPESRPAATASTTSDGVTLSPPMIDFGYQLVGATGPQMVETVTNSGAASLVITDISVSGRDRRDFLFTYGFSLPVTVAPGQSITINFTFKPLAPWRAGTRNARLEISERHDSQYMPLSGIGATCGGAVPGCLAIQFGDGCPDGDGDGLNDAWEIAGGIDINNDGRVDATNDVLLPGADPTKPDVYLHYDYTYASDHDHNPPPQAIQYIVDAFAANGVNLHIDPQHNAISEDVARVVTLANPTDPACTGPIAISAHQLREMFPNLALLKLAYHYMIFGHYATCDPTVDPNTGQPYCSACPNDPENPVCEQIAAQPPQPGNLGTAEIYGDDAIVATQPFTDVGLPITLEAWAGLAMHELGHNLGLEHGGLDCFNFKPNYVGVMNYNFYTKGIPVGASPGDAVPKSCVTDADCTSAHPAPAYCSLATNTCFRIDYNDRQFNSLDESGATTGINEELGLQGGADNTDISWTKVGRYVRVPTNGSPIDFNGNGESTDTNVIFDVNGDGQKTPLDSQNDWLNLRFSYQCQPTFTND